MGRFSFIPLEFEKLSEGLEREIILKKDTQDIYILDDYKIPVSSTNMLKENVNHLNLGITDLVSTSKTLSSEYIIEKNKIIDSSNVLDFELIKISEQNHFKRVNSLEDYQIYLEGFRQEIDISLQDIKKQIEDVINLYYIDLDNALSSVTTKYNSNLSLYNTYVTYKNSYINIINIMETELGVLSQLLSTKLKKLGSGSGTYDSTITQTTSVVKENSSWFRWLSNSNSVYPGPRIANSYNDGLEWRSYSETVPKSPNDFVGGEDDNTIIANSSKTEPSILLFRGASNGNSNLIRCYWAEAIENDGFTSSDNYFNQYGRKVMCVYQKTFSETIVVPIHIDI